MSRVLSALALILLAPPAFAQEALPPGAKVAKLESRAASITLDGAFAYSQLLLTAKLDGGDAVDVTRMVQVLAPDFVAVSPTGVVRPKADGTGDIKVSLAGKTITIPVTASGFAAAAPVSFVKDVQPVLSKVGCNAGTCHGAQAGKNGFKLSLRGYDPIYDYRALTDDLEARRFNRAAPEKSLMLLKTSGAIPHQGGVLTQPGEPYYETLKRWISQGVKLDLNAPRVKSIEVFPKDPTLGKIGTKQQFAVVATYTDGAVRDVTAESFIETSNGEVANVDKAGLLTSARRGEATMLARYEGAYAASTVIVLGDRTGFAWEQRPVHNVIDELVDKKLQRVKVLASPVADDAEFLRRVYIDLTGLPPTADDVKAFLAKAGDARAKRDALIDELVGSEAFIEHWTNRWADLLVVNRKFLGDPGAAAFRKWIRDAVANNTPYDKFSYDILTASGSNVANPPASYYKVLRTADAVMENTTQLFLAVRFNCNKCHDHPFEKWTQDNYYNLAAFFAQVTRGEDPKYKGQKIGGSAVEGAKPLVEMIADGKGGTIKHDRTGEVAAAFFPYKVEMDAVPGEALRTQAAKWITSPKNPYFAKSYVNRVWSYLTGTGLIEPVDDIRAGNPPTNPELLDRLTDEFVKGGFDTRKLIKTIAKSRTYQLAIATNQWNKDDDINYSHAIARRLPAEVLYDSIHRVTGSTSRLPGLPAGARAALLPDSNVELPGGFLELFGKPVRESACECERSGGMNLGPILAMVNGPIVADAVQDPNNRLNKLVAAEKDDTKVVDEIYLAVLNRFPNAKEKDAGVKALRGATADHATMTAEHAVKQKAFDDYAKTLDDKQAAWEKAMLDQKPTAWETLKLDKVEAKQGPTPATAKDVKSLKLNPDGSVLASGTTQQVEIYTVTGTTKLKDPLTAIRIETLADPSLPKNGPGRASENGNFVLSEFTVTYRNAAKSEDKPKATKLTGAAATFEQGGYPVGSAIDGNRATGWAISPQLGKDHAALFRFQTPVPAVKDGVALTAVLHHEFGTGHAVGKFRISVTTDKSPKLASPLTADQATLLGTPAAERTADQKAKVRAMYLAQDKEHSRLAAEAGKAPPSDARVLGAQDLVWALINTPAFLFNH